MTSKLVLIGGGGHASDVAGLIERDLEQQATIIGYCADSPSSRQDRFRLGQYYGTLNDFPHAVPSEASYLIAVGYSQDRMSVFGRLDVSNRHAITLVDPQATISTGCEIGNGSVIMNSHLSPNAQIGQHVYASHYASIGHDTVVEDFCTLLPGARLSGGVLLHRGVLVGTNAVVAENLSVGANAVVAAGAVVLRDVPEGWTAIGNPAKLLPGLHSSSDDALR